MAHNCTESVSNLEVKQISDPTVGLRDISEPTANGPIIERCSTLPFTSTSDANDPQIMGLQDRSQMYDGNLWLVKKYCYGTSKIIDRLCTTATTAEQYKEILKKKSDVWEISERLSQEEDRLKLKVWIWFHLLVRTMLGVSAVVLMHINTISQFYGGMCLIFMYTAEVSVWIKELNPNRRTGGAELARYARILAEYREKLD
jgi:hypothetical protein